MKIICLILMSICFNVFGMEDLEGYIKKWNTQTIVQINREISSEKIKLYRGNIDEEAKKKLLQKIETLEKIVEEKKAKLANKEKTEAVINKPTVPTTESTYSLRTQIPVKKEKNSIPLDQITDVKKIVALQNGSVILLCKESGDDKFVLKQFNGNTLSEFLMPVTETKIFKDVTPLINDIAVYQKKLAIATFYKKETKSLIGKSEDTESVIFLYDFDSNNQPPYKVQDAHKTPIENLFVDDNFVLSQSTAGNIRFFAVDDIKKPTTIRGDVARGTKVVDPEAEYKAKNTILYYNKCLILEESTILFGNELYVKYIDDMADILSQNKIGAYKKEDTSPYIGAINNNGDALVYDQRSRSLIHTQKTESEIKETVIKREDLPEELAFKVAKQIYYIENKVLLVYEDEIVSMQLESNLKPSKQSNPIFSLEKSKAPKSRSVIHTTCVNGNTLWLIKQQKDGNSKSYTMESISLENTNE
ncbi:hypothetical protein EKK58_02315 [Candidatus Dependentiae bacterium]|nr:MAG: hypothetical protein EKK58_02315 [Candidatus Dependentiae bacterium]